MRFTLIKNGDIYTPEPQDAETVALADGKIAKVGRVDEKALAKAGFEVEVVDADGCVVTPGLIDPHEHLVGAGGEEGFATRMPEVRVEDLVEAGITTVVGLLGTDTATRALECLHAKASQLCDEGLTAFMFTGGFELPPRTLLKTVLDDIVMIDKIVGAGEIAISDFRWVDPTEQELAHLVTQTMVAGKIGGKAGVTHLHVGEGKQRLSLLHALLDDYDIPPESIYPTHITRTQALLQDAVKLAKRGCYVDMDTTEENLADCLASYRDQGGPIEKLTASSDAHTPGGSPRKLYKQFVACGLDRRFSLEEILPVFTRNVASVLKLTGKGELKAGCDSDVLVLERETLALRHVFAGGRQFVKDGERIVQSKQQQQMEASYA